MQENKNLTWLMNRDFKKTNGILHIIKGEKFFSRKNAVFEVEIIFKDGKKQPYILKEFIGDDKKSKIKKELFWYDILKDTNLKVPSVFYKGADFLIMEHLSSKTLLDYMIEKENKLGKVHRGFNDTGILKKELAMLADTLKWIYQFNKQAVILTGDSFILKDLNLRNFIIKDNTVFRVDFEDCSRGMPEEDFAVFIAFFLAYDPPFTDWKKSKSALMKKMCTDEMGLDIDIIEKGIENEFEEMQKRRKHKGNL